MIKTILLAALGLVLLLLAAVTVNTLRQRSHQIIVPPASALAVDEQATAERLAGAIRFQTLANREDANASAAEFHQLHAYLQLRYPKVHALLERELVGDYSLLYTWRGSDNQAKPVLLMAHQDVVPISPGTESKWEVPPFAGEVSRGFVWGRGTCDNKGNLIAQLEAVETLLAAGFKPRQTVYLAYGHDEEVGGARGAVQIAKLLQERKVQLDFVLDEGLLITDGIIPGLSQPAALIGIAEKGYLSLVLKVSATPGHGSMPPPNGDSAIGMMSAALHRIDAEQLPAELRGVAREMFEVIAPETHGFNRVALSNLWLFGPIVQAKLEKAASTNAWLRTTTALTIISAGNAENVIPGLAEATVNFRLLPGDTVAGVTQHVKDKLGSEHFDLTALPGASDASAVSATRSSSYQLLNRTLRSLFPDVLVAPGLMLAATDSRHFAAISDHVYRFSPMRFKPEDVARFHGINERISMTNLAELVRFYHQLLRNASSPALEL